MSHEEEIRKIQEELLQLQEQTKQQYYRISELQRRLADLLPPEQRQRLAPAAAKPAFSLENFIGLRLIHFIGIVVLVIGLSIGVKYAIDRNLISEVMRISLAYLAGGVLFGLSTRLKKRYEMFSAILLSGGLASLYFTTYAAFVYYRMMPFAVAYGLMVALTVYAVYQAIVYSREVIAILGLIGAYAIPFLISPNTGNPNMFFLYILIINLGIIYLGWRKQWNATVLVAQIATWVLYFGWAAVQLSEKHATTGWIFLAVFFLLFYTYIIYNETWLASRFGEVRQVVLMLNNLAIYMGAVMLIGYTSKEVSYAAVTLVMSGFLFGQAALFHYAWKDEPIHNRLLSAGLLLFIIFIAQQWEGMTVTLLWLLVAVVVFGLGVLLRKARFRIAAIVLMAVTLGKLVLLDSLQFSAVQKVICYVLLGVLLLVISFFYQKFKSHLFPDE